MKTPFIKTTCSVCNIKLTKKNKAAGKKTTCKPCYNAHMREYYQKHKDRHREFMYSWRARNKEKVKDMQRKYAVKHFGSYTECCAYYTKKTRDAMTDGFIRHSLYAHEPLLKHTDITPELIVMKRNQLILKRKIQSYGKN